MRKLSFLGVFLMAAAAQAINLRGQTYVGECSDMFPGNSWYAENCVPGGYTAENLAFCADNKAKNKCEQDIADNSHGGLTGACIPLGQPSYMPIQVNVPEYGFLRGCQVVVTYLGIK